MIKKAAAVGAILACLPAVCAAQSSSAERAKVQQQLNQFANAIRHHDEKAMNRLLPDRFVYNISPEVSLRRDEYFKRIQQLERSNLNIAFRIDSLKTALDGATGTATVTMWADVQHSRGTRHRVETVERVLLQFSRYPDRLVLESADLLSAVHKVDGRVIATRDNTRK